MNEPEFLWSVVHGQPQRNCQQFSDLTQLNMTFLWPFLVTFLDYGAFSDCGALNPWSHRLEAGGLL